MANLNKNNSAKTIDIDVNKQKLTLLDGDVVVACYPVSTAKNGIGQQNGSECTPSGWHAIRIKIGIDAEFSPINDVLTDEKKISGSAQTRRGGILLQHGTTLFTVDVDKMFSLLTVGKEKIADKLISSVKKRVTSVTAINDIPKNELAKALESAFSEGREIEIGTYSDTELKRAKELKEKYASMEWIDCR